MVHKNFLKQKQWITVFFTIRPVRITSVYKILKNTIYNITKCYPRFRLMSLNLLWYAILCSVFIKAVQTNDCRLGNCTKIWLLRNQCYRTVAVQIYHQQSILAEGHFLHCKVRNQGRSSAQRQDFHCKLRNPGCSWMDRCGSFPLLSASHSLFSIWIDLLVLKISQ